MFSFRLPWAPSGSHQVPSTQTMDRTGTFPLMVTSSRREASVTEEQNIGSDAQRKRASQWRNKIKQAEATERGRKTAQIMTGAEESSQPDMIEVGDQACSRPADSACHLLMWRVCSPADQDSMFPRSLHFLSSYDRLVMRGWMLVEWKWGRREWTPACGHPAVLHEVWGYAWILLLIGRIRLSALERGATALPSTAA